MSEDNRVIEAILHYQRNIDRNLHDEKKILHCINKLLKMPITVSHLKETGIGRTVNSLRKNPGEVGDTAKQLVSKWKDIVAAEPADNEEDKPSTPPPQTSSHSKKHKSSSKGHDKHVEAKSSHKEDKYDKRIDCTKSSKNKSEAHSSSSKRKRLDSDLEDNKKLNGNRCDSDDDRKVESDNSSSNKHTKHKKNKHRSKSRDENEFTKRTVSSHKEDNKNCSEKVKSKHNEENIASKSTSKEKNGKSVKFSKSKPKEEMSSDEDGICSTSGASFAEALGVSFIPDKITVTKKSQSHQSPSSTLKKSTSSTAHPKVKSSTSKIVNSAIPPPPAIPLKLDIDKTDTNISSLLPEISTNYQPLGHYHLIDEQNSYHKQKSMTEEEALSLSIMSRNQRTKVFSGNKTGWGKVPTLFEICVRVLQDNFNAMEYTGGVPYHILKPVLERATADQLFALENHNPYLIEDTDELWRLHSQREFRTKKREELESWREFYLRCIDEREAKLRALTVNIKLSQDKCLPVRQTKLAYVDSAIKPPRNIARKQAKYGTAASSDKRPLVTPSARLSTLAAAGAAGQISVPNPGGRAAASNHSPTKPKKAPLMQKTLALMKNSTRYKR